MLRLLNSQRARHVREQYLGALGFNVCALILPALYSTLVKFWVAGFDSRMVVTTDSYVYIATVVEILNEGLPRAAWCTIGNASTTRQRRYSLAYTLILTQSMMGLLMSLGILSAANVFAKAFVPAEVRDQSINFVRVSAFSAFSNCLEAAVAAASRALDRPDAPLVLSSIKFALNIVLDMLLISTFRVRKAEPTINLQAAIQLTCNLLAALGGLLYFIGKQTSSDPETGSKRPKVSKSALWELIMPGVPTFIESAVRNIIYLWLVSNVVRQGTLYATAWGIFNTIRWGLVMVPVQALEATTLTFVGHNWGLLQASLRELDHSANISSSDLRNVTKPAFKSATIALLFEVPLCLFLSFLGIRPFARLLSKSDEVADLTAHMWKTIDWCYIMFAVSTQLASILLATRPMWFLAQSLVSNLLYVLPWAVVCHITELNTDNAWTYYAYIFGGSLVFSSVMIPLVLGLWAFTLIRGTQGCLWVPCITKRVHLPVHG